MSKWISAEDRLPESDTLCLIYIMDPSLGVRIYTATYFSYFVPENIPFWFDRKSIEMENGEWRIKQRGWYGWDESDGAYYLLSAEDVTHWMPLPDEPEDEIKPSPVEIDGCISCLEPSNDVTTILNKATNKHPLADEPIIIENYKDKSNV